MNPMAAEIESGEPRRPRGPRLEKELRAANGRDERVARLAYTDPSELAARYGFSDELAGRLAGIHAITDAVIAG